MLVLQKQVLHLVSCMK